MHGRWQVAPLLWRVTTVAAHHTVHRRATRHANLVWYTLLQTWSHALPMPRTILRDHDEAGRGGGEEQCAFTDQEVRPRRVWDLGTC